MLVVFIRVRDSVVVVKILDNMLIFFYLLLNVNNYNKVICVLIWGFVIKKLYGGLVLWYVR